MALDWSLLGQAPQFGNVLASFEAGRDARRQTETKNALARFESDPEGAISALNGVDPAMGMKLREQHTSRQEQAAKKAVFQEVDPEKRMGMARETADPEMIRAAAAMTEDERAAESAKVEAVGDFFFGLKYTPVERRVAAIQEMSPALKAAGLSDEEIAQIDPSDAGLQQIIGRTQTADRVLKMIPDPEPAPRAPSGFEFADDGSLRPIRGGPGDPEYIGRAAGVRREAVVSRPTPSRATGGAARSSSAPPPGFTERVR